MLRLLCVISSWCRGLWCLVNHLADEERADCFTLIVLLLLICVLYLYLVVPWIGLLSVRVAFPGHTHLFYFSIQIMSTKICA